jgi:hypothetical protein
MGFLSAFALAIHSNSESGGDQSKSGLSKNQLEPTSENVWQTQNQATHYPVTITLSFQSKGLGTTAYNEE